MAHKEEGRSSPAQLPDEVSSLKRVFDDREHTVDVSKEEGILLLRVSRGERSIFSAAVLPDNRVQVVFDAAGQERGLNAQALHALANGEKEKPPEYPPITIEGFAGRQGSLRPSEARPGEKEYYVYLYYRPTPDEDWGYTLPYHVHFFGEAAEQLNREKISTGARLRISGELHTRLVKERGGGQKTVYEVYAQEPPELFKGKPTPLPGETRKRG